MKASAFKNYKKFFLFCAYIYCNTKCDTVFINLVVIIILIIGNLQYICLKVFISDNEYHYQLFFQIDYFVTTSHSEYTLN